MNFLKSITAAALLATAISTSTMAAIDLSDQTLNYNAFLGKLGTVAMNGKNLEIIITDDLIDAKDRLQAYDSNASALVKANVERTAKMIAGILTHLEQETDSHDATGLKGYITDGTAVRKIVLEDFKPTLEGDDLKDLVDAALGDILADLHPQSKVQNEVLELVKLVQDPTTFMVDIGGTEVSLESIADKYVTAGKNKAQLAIVDAEAAKITAGGKDLATILAEHEAHLDHVDTSDRTKVEKHYQMMKESYDAGKAKAKPTAEHEAGAAVLTAARDLFDAGYLEFDTNITKLDDLKDKAKALKLVEAIAARLALVDSLEAKLKKAQKAGPSAPTGGDKSSLPNMGRRGRTATPDASSGKVYTKDQEAAIAKHRRLNKGASVEQAAAALGFAS